MNQKDGFLGTIHMVMSKGKFKEPQNGSDIHAINFAIILMLEGEICVLTVSLNGNILSF